MYIPSKELIEDIHQRLAQSVFCDDALITTKQLRELNVTSAHLRGLIRLIKVSHGIYQTTAAASDRYLELQKRFSSIVYSHEAALQLHKMAAMNPNAYTVTIPSNHNSNYLIEKENLDVHKAISSRYHLGIATVQSPSGNTVTVYNPEKTICDLFAMRNRNSHQNLAATLKVYLEKPDRNLKLLVHYAQLMCVDKPLKLYLDVLL